jgi:hypothetical protein
LYIVTVKMGRSGGGGRSSSSGGWGRSSSYSYSSPKSPVSYSAPAPAPTTHTVKVEQPGFFSNVMQGFGLGAGQSMAFNLFKPFQSSSSSIVSSTSSVATPAATPVAAPELPKEYVQCMKEYDNKKDLCKQYLENDD